MYRIIYLIYYIQIVYTSVISQTPKYVWNMFDFNKTSDSHSYLVLFVPKTLSVVWYFIINLIPLKVYGYLALFESKSVVIFIFVYCLIIFFKLHKFTWTLYKVFPFSNLSFYIVFYYWNTHLEIYFNYFFCYFIYLRLVIPL